MLNTELAELLSRALNAERSLIALGGTRSTLEQERARNKARVGAAKWRVSQRDTVDRIFDVAQARLHVRTVGSYERLLTLIANDVLASKIEIRLELGTNKRNGKPSLDIVARREGGDIDVSRATGGSLMNVLATGLRVSALTKSGARQFAAFDESECWISPENVPAYGNVLVRLSTELGFQCLLISHHDPRMFQGAFVVRLDGSPETGLVALPETPLPEPSDGRGHDLFTSIRLVNFQSHTDTVVPLCHGMTCLVGGNDIGKSAVIRALTAIMEGDFRDSDIRHGQKEASVELTLADGRIAAVRRTMKKKLRWELAGPTARDLESEGSDVPDFIAAALGIRIVGDLNLHVSRQSRPNFLLENEPGMDTRRAEVLSVGREAMHLDRLMEAWKKQTREDAATIRKGEEEDARYEFRLARLSNVPRLLEAAGKLKEGIDALGVSLGGMAYLERNAAALEAALAERAELQAMTRALAPLTEPPVLQETAAVLAAAQDWEAVRRDMAIASARIRALTPLAPPPELQPDEGLSEAADRLKAAMNLAADLKRQSLTLADIPGLPELAPTAGMMEVAQALDDVAWRLAELWTEAEALDDIPEPPELLENGSLGEISRLLDEAVRRSAALGLESTVLAPLAPPPGLHPTVGLEEAYLSLEQAAADVAQLTETARAVADLLPPPLIETTGELLSAAERLEGAMQVHAELAARGASLKALAMPPELEETTGMEEAARALDEAARDVADLSTRMEALTALAEPPALLPTGEVREAADAIEAARTQTGILWSRAQDLEAEIEEVAGNLVRWHDENDGICPTCLRDGFDPLAPEGIHAYD